MGLDSKHITAISFGMFFKSEISLSLNLQHLMKPLQWIMD